MVRFVVAAMSHETNTFSPIATPLAAFCTGREVSTPVRGEEAVEACRGTRTCMAAFLDLAQGEGAKVEVPVYAHAAPSGPVHDDAFDFIADAVCASVREGCDAVLLDLHGAMVTETYDDGEGELLRRIRAISPEVPIAVALDFHANMTRAMVRHASVITGYCTYPHVDMYETAERCGRTLIRAMRGEVVPRMHCLRVPMMTHTLRQAPDKQPMKDIMDKAIASERGGHCLNASVFGGFPMADIAHLGLSVVTVFDERQAAPEALERELLDMAWERRAGFVYEVEPVVESVRRAKGLDGPVILVDHGDNVFSGGTQDVMATVAEVMRQELNNVAVGPIWDPGVVATLIDAGIGARVTVQLGGKTPMPALHMGTDTLEVSGTVKRITDGRYTVTCPMMTGVTLDHGRSVVLDTGAMEILVCEQRMEPFDLGVFRHAGIEPTEKHFLLVKSRQHFRAGFEPIAKHIVLLSGPGVTSSDYSLFDFAKVPRPMYPLDPDMDPSVTRLDPGGDTGY